MKSETKKTSDTDYYMNLLANGNKTLPEKKESITESEIQESESSSRRSTSSVKSSSSRKSNVSKTEKSYSAMPPSQPAMNNSPKISSTDDEQIQPRHSYSTSKEPDVKKRSITDNTLTKATTCSAGILILTSLIINDHFLILNKFKQKRLCW